MALEDQSWVEGVWKMLAIKDAIASIALSHERDCTCRTCLAARGDMDAFANIVYELDTRSEGNQ